MLRLLLCSLYSVSVNSKVPSVVLNNGVRMPMMALGTNTFFNSSAVEADVRLALGLGFVSIDTARDYIDSQEGVGRAIRNLSRDSYFLITKVGGLDALSLPIAEYHGITKAMNDDLKALGVDHVDLMLLHFPPVRVLGNRCKSMQAQWRALEDFYKAGKARAIGVSNYCQGDIECVLQKSTVVPAVNQVLFHVGMGVDPRGLKSYLDAKGITMQAYSPLGEDKITGKDMTLITGNLTNGIGRAYNKSGAQVALRWVAEHGVPFNTKSSKAQHLQQDLDVFSFKLNAQDLSTLDSATQPAGEPNSQFGGLPLVGNCSATAMLVV